MQNKSSKKSVFIIDGSSFLYRVYYGLRPLHTSKGMAIHAVYGFCRMLKKLIDQFQVEHVLVVWDSKGKTKRHDIFPDYKATRQEAPSDIFQQKELIREVTSILKIAQLSEVGQEADDLMYAFAKKCNKSGYDAVIVSSDKDMRQAVSENIIIYDPFFEKIMDKDSVQQRYGFEIEKIPFYFSLIGDTSDNIPGVKGVGEKTATELVKQFVSLNDMYQNLNKVEKERTRRLLLESKDNAYISYELFLLQDVYVDTEVSGVSFDEKQWTLGLTFFEKLEFKSLVKDILKKHTSFSIVSDHTSSADKKLHEKYEFVCITDQDLLVKLCQKLENVAGFALDTETDSLDPVQANLIGISISYVKGQAFYIPLAHSANGQLTKDFVLEYLGPILQNKKIMKYMHNAKYDIIVLNRAQLPVGGIVFDTLIAASLLAKEWEKIGLKDLSEQILDEKMVSYKELMSMYQIDSFKDLPLDGATVYAAADAHQTLQLFEIFKLELEKQGLSDLFYGIELPVNDVLIAMQQEGIYCNADILLHLDKQVEQDLSLIEKKIYQYAGHEINLNSPKQIRELLFEKFKLQPQKKSGKTQLHSTDAEVLAILAKEHEVPMLLLAYRELFKLKSTYINGLPTYINPITGKIHTSWNQTGVATGRISSSSPNLQNIPTNGLEFGKEYDVNIRSAFQSSRGWSFIAADYSQIELRILAQFSKDQALIDAFLTDKDIHTQTAAEIFDISLDKVTVAQRNIGKRLNFSILYGLTPYGLSKDLDIPFAEAKKYIEKYFEKYPKVLLWMEHIVEEVKKVGYTKTLYGRRRYLPGIYEKNKNLYELARRIAINTPVQGTAAEITKMGMIQFYKQIVELGFEAKVLLQIHDELLITCPDYQVDKVEKLLKKSLEGVVGFDVPFGVTLRSGKSWKEVTK
ncbi:DNA polymerase I [Candidatus Dependentiae bacterium]|nr:DNA polymerase I [Candidatus Dependentiae bacterium]